MPENHEDKQYSSQKKFQKTMRTILKQKEIPGDNENEQYSSKKKCQETMRTNNTLG